MARCMRLLVCIITVLAWVASADVVEHTFRVGNLTVQPLCKEQNIVAVNEQFPGPPILVREGDQLVVHVVNESPYDITIHWHGIFQLQTGWADGPAYVTQCPIIPGNNYTYRFNVTMQEGTLWWHAHFSWLRATVYGSLIIRPRAGRSYPHIQPHQEFPILLGEWWNANIMDVVNQAALADAYTINGRPGDLYECANKSTYNLTVEQGKIYMLRVINAALNTQLFFKLAGHNLTVVAIDASYTEPYNTDFIVIAPGQTTDVLFTANATPGAYYMAAHPYVSAPSLNFTNSTTTAILQYQGASSASPQMPVLPPNEDTPSAHRFYSNLTALRNYSRLPILYGGSKRLPTQLDERMFITIGLGEEPCSSAPCPLAASMNNVSYQPPTKLSLLEAHYRGEEEGIYTDDFPDTPPVVFDYTNPNIDRALWTTLKSTRVKRLRFNSSVEIVLQNTAISVAENHPMHLHGFNFYVLAQGFGNYDSAAAEGMLNLVNPQVRNTIAVPTGGWAVIRFRANNPGVWFMHCHLDIHLTWGLAMAFVVDDGPTRSTSLPPPPSDLPQC